MSVTVSPLRVRAHAKDRPERKLRGRRWFSRAAAVAAVEETDLSALIAAFAG